MAKKTKNVETKKKSPKAPEAAPKAPKVKVETQTSTEVVEEPGVTITNAADKNKLISRKHSGLSMDGQVQLLDLAQRHFIEQKDPDLAYPQPIRIGANRVIGAGILATLAEHAERGENQYAVILQTTIYPALEQAAEGMGIKLPKIAVLPSPEENPNDVILTADKMKVSKETKNQIKHEIAIKDGEQPELDPKKITAEDDVKKALEYIFTATKGKSLAQTVAESIEFIKEFRINQASQAENAEKAIKNYNSYNAGDWLDDIFGYFKPTVFFNGIGKGIISVAATEANPIHAFIILRDALKDKKTGKPALSDMDIAYLARSIAKWVGNSLIDSNKKAIENLDSEKNKNEIATCKAAIRYHENVIGIFTDPSSELADKYLESDTKKSELLTKHIVNSYYGKNTDVSKYKNIKENVQQHIGIILNYFRTGGTENPNYAESNITELVAYTDEELAELKKAELKEKAAATEEEAKKN